MSTALVREERSVPVGTSSRFRINRSFWPVLLRRALLMTPVDREMHVLAADGRLVMFVKHPIVHFRERVTVFADEAQAVPLLRLQARSLATVNIIFDIVEVVSEETIGSVQLRGHRSLVHDRLVLMDPEGSQIGAMEEVGASLLRRIVPFMLSRHRMVVRGLEVARMRQIFRVVSKEFEVTIAPGPFDQRLVLVCALLALMTRARRES